MLTPIRCFTCGRSTGHVTAAFDLALKELSREKLAERGTAPTLAAIDAHLHVSAGPILDRLGIERDCCRKVLLTAMRFSNYN
jgi:DNA-directed RNA polymerase subunit N (RpoN/RPB10)